MKNKIRWKVGLLGSPVHLPDEPEAQWSAIKKDFRRQRDGTTIRDYFNHVERFAEAVCRDQRIDLSAQRMARCQQIVREYEPIFVDQRQIDQLDQLMHLFRENPASIGKKWRDFFIGPNYVSIKFRAGDDGYKPLQRDQIDLTLYCAAQVLLSLDDARRSFESQKPFRLALECMKVERWVQHLGYTLAYSHKHNGKAGRDARQAKQKARRRILATRDRKKPITEADYRSLRDEFGVTQKTLKNDLDAIRKGSP